MTAALFMLTLALAAPTPPTGLQKGDEFTFVGTVAEAIDRPANRFRRDHALQLRVLVLERHEKWADVAVLTRLTRTEDAVTGALPGVTGNGPGSDRVAPPSVRLDLVRVHADGTVHQLAPLGPLPLKLNTETPARGLPALPLDTFSPSELGVFPPRVPQNNTGESWTVGVAGNRPAETWQVKETQPVNGERCQLLLMNQMSPDWTKPEGGVTSWHRADAVWVSTQDNTARKVHRVIRQRDGRAEAPAAWVEVKYELKDQTHRSGRTYDRARRDVEVAYLAITEAAQLVPDAVKLGPRPFETRLARLDAHLEETDASSPYREVMVAARRAFDAGRRGETAPIAKVSATAPAVEHGAKTLWPEPTQVAPDFKAGTFRLADHRDKPVVLVFFRPGGETGDLALAVANAIDQRYRGKVVVAPLAVFSDVAAGEKARDRLKFTIPVYDGSTAASTYGVETAPRFALIGTDGKVRWAFTGVGAETGFLLREEADRLAPPASPAGAGGTTPAPGPALPPILPRP